MYAEMLDRNGLSVTNQGDEPTFDGPRGQSHIDVTAATDAIQNKIYTWHVRCNEDNISDHRTIEFEVRL